MTYTATTYRSPNTRPPLSGRPINHKYRGMLDWDGHHRFCCDHGHADTAEGQANAADCARAALSTIAADTETTTPPADYKPWGVKYA